MDQINGKWQGMYSYAGEFSSNKMEHAVPFELVMEGRNGVFTGQIHEDLTAGGIEDDITVIGSVSGSNIEFTKIYAGGRTKQEPSGYQVYYKGTWDDKNSRYRGTWEIDRFDIVDEELVHYTTSGIWEMKRA